MTLAASHENGSLNPMSFCDQHGAVMLERLRYQRETGRFCDVVVRVHGRQFAAHRNVLAASSPYFDAILKFNLVTKEQVTVNSTHATAFEHLLNYMYSGSVVIDRSCVAELLKLANNFLITKVKNYCAEYLDRNLDAANCLSVKALATKYNLPLLLKAATEFFDMNINRCLMESVDLLKYSAQQLQQLLQEPKYHNQVSPDVHLKLATRWASHDVDKRQDDMKSLLSFCALNRVSSSTLESVLDFSPIVTKNRQTRIWFMTELVRVGVTLGKYMDEYNILMEGGDATFVPPVLIHHQDEQYEEDSDEEEEPPVEGEATTSQVLGKWGNEQISVEPVGAAPVKLKIKLGGPKRKEDKPSRSGKRRRNDVNGTAPGTSSENLEEEDGIDGVFIVCDEAALFPEPGGVDPATIDEDDEEENVPGGQFMCIHCRFATNETEDYHRHMAKRHDRNTLFVCTLCEEGFEANWSASFYEHVSSHLQKEAPWQCDRCDFSTDEGIHVLLSHRLIHTGDRPFKCAECGWCAQTRCQLWSHERIHCGEASGSCTQCGRAFCSVEALNAHTNSHSETRNHVCVDCGWASTTELHLLNHRRRSHQIDVYSCHVEGCEYVSTKKSQLAAHLRTHLHVRAHICKICGRGFIEKSHVVRHERIHLTDKPFKCESCDYASSRRDKLKEHILKYHNGTAPTGAKPYQRRRHKRAKQLAQAIASQKEGGLDVRFRPIESNRDRIEQWQSALASTGTTHQAPRALSVAPHAPSSIHLGPSSPGSLSLMNVPLMGGMESPMIMMNSLDKDMDMEGVSGMRLHESPLVTPVPRSPHNHTADPFGMNAVDESQRPMSLPPYGGQNWFT